MQTEHNMAEMIHEETALLHQPKIKQEAILDKIAPVGIISFYAVCQFNDSWRFRLSDYMTVNPLVEMSVVYLYIVLLVIIAAFAFALDSPRAQIVLHRIVIVGVSIFSIAQMVLSTWEMHVGAGVVIVIPLFFLHFMFAVFPILSSINEINMLTAEEERSTQTSITV
jgi:hypothetical protein